LHDDTAADDRADQAAEHEIDDDRPVDVRALNGSAADIRSQLHHPVQRDDRRGRDERGQHGDDGKPAADAEPGGDRRTEERDGDEGDPRQQ